MQMQAKNGGILYDRGGKLGTNYPDLEPGKEFWNHVRVYPVLTTNHYSHWPIFIRFGKMTDTDKE